MAKKRREEEEEHENEERWLVTYADMITLLMVLFIVLFSMATIDAHKFNALKDSLAGKHEAASVLEGGQTVVNGGVIAKLETASQSSSASISLPSAAQQFDSTGASSTAQTSAATAALAAQTAAAKAAAAEKNNLQQVQQEIQASLQAHGVADDVKFTIDRRGLVVTVVTDQVLFPSGQANIQPTGQSILDAIGAPLASVPNDIAVDGYTDNQPIATSQFPTNWELSTARATSVLRYLVDHGDVSADKIGATGYGEYRPVVPNDTAARRAQNRRVEVVVLTNANQAASS